MTGDQGLGEEFGCEHCWPDAADSAWEARGKLTRVAEIIDESHYHVMILACFHCTQRFVSVFTEEIDWESGDDPQYWTLLPITGAEAAELVQERVSPTDANLNALGPDRRSLRRDHRKGVAPGTFWGVGVRVGRRD